MSARHMSKEEFEASYVVDSGIALTGTPARRISSALISLSLEARPCDCGEPECTGWQMVGPK